MTSIPKNCKRLIEVDFPTEPVNEACGEEKYVPYGHPSGLHRWWARRPLASSRATLLACLLPDPADAQCPPGFREAARDLLSQNLRPAGSSDSDLRETLLKFIADYAAWEKAGDPSMNRLAEKLVVAAHGERPLVVDPFAGGGSIPLEALRLGCDASAFDINPVAGLTVRALLEEIPGTGKKLSEEVKAQAAQMNAKATDRLRAFYPGESQSDQPIFYLWARTARCESPKCGAEIPLLQSLWLVKKAENKKALRYSVNREVSPPEIEVEIFSPKVAAEVQTTTIKRSTATCPACDTALPAPRVRAQLSEQRGGADVVFSKSGKRIGGARLVAVASLQPGLKGRSWRTPSANDYDAVRRAQEKAAQLDSAVVPDEPMPEQGTLGFRVQAYGMTQWSNILTARQKLAMAEFVRSVGEIKDPTTRLLSALALGKLAEFACALCIWWPKTEVPLPVFRRHALPMIWTFAESVPTSESSGSLIISAEKVAAVVEAVGEFRHRGRFQAADAAESPLPDESCSVWATDPPYYDNVPYSYLSDFFYVWLKRALAGSAILDTRFIEAGLSPKSREIIEANPSKKRKKGALAPAVVRDAAFYERQMARAFSEGRRVLQPNGIGCVVFAHKTTEGWEALLNGLIKGGWVITASWAIATEMPNRLRAKESAALATSVHLVCRPRDPEAPIGDWADVARELPTRVSEWMNRLSAEGIRGADLVFACIGPAMEVYSRYSKVEDAEGREIPLGGNAEARDPYEQGYLAKVWEVVGRIALEQVLSRRDGTATGLEEDARLTALFLWTMQSSGPDAPIDSSAEAEEEDEEEGLGADDDEDEEEGAAKSKKKGLKLPFDVARRFAQPLGIHLDQWDGRVIEIDKGVVRLLPVADRATQLFGAKGVRPSDASEDVRGGPRQVSLFPDGPPVPPVKAGGKKKTKGKKAAASEEVPEVQVKETTLDRVHAAMLLFRDGHSNELRELVKEERRKGPDFERLANALSALYPRGSEERRLVEGMIATR